MQEAVPEGLGVMAAVLGLEPAKIDEICRSMSRPQQQERVEVANFNGPDQTVISGDKAGVENASAALRTAGAKKVLPLPVSAPFHCGLMGSVQPRLREVLGGLAFRSMKCPVVTNVEAQPNQDPERARSLLVDQVVRSVRFTECVHALSSLGARTFVELGPGRVLSGLVRRMEKAARVLNVEDPATLQSAKAGLVL
jgi:[acyl-carrier-protein] S-malonyltransferase